MYNRWDLHVDDSTHLDLHHLKVFWHNYRFSCIKPNRLLYCLHHLFTDSNNKTPICYWLAIYSNDEFLCACTFSTISNSWAARHLLHAGVSMVISLGLQHNVYHDLLLSRLSLCHVLLPMRRMHRVRTINMIGFHGCLGLSMPWWSLYILRSPIYHSPCIDNVLSYHCWLGPSQWMAKAFYWQNLVQGHFVGAFSGSVIVTHWYPCLMSLSPSSDFRPCGPHGREI